jgi:KamA family protein
VDELILSGGDPLLFDTPQLQRLSDKLHPLPQLQRLRIHTRLPLVLPERIDTELLAWLQAVPWQTVLVIHANHPHELKGDVTEALTALKQVGLTLLNQSVLLRGINDDVTTLEELSRKLFACGVLPYYLHQLDRVQGAAHFELSDEQALRLHDELKNRQPGYLVPRLVREIAGEGCKQPL